MDTPNKVVIFTWFLKEYAEYAAEIAPILTNIYPN